MMKFLDSLPCYIQKKKSLIIDLLVNSQSAELLPTFTPNRFNPSRMLFYLFTSQLQVRLIS